MNIHNLMEDVVAKKVNSLYDQLKKDGISWLSCDCENCRLDTISYVLNRVAPKYVVSGRGVTHSAESIKDPQVTADIEALAIEGMRIVSSTKRPFHANDRKECCTQKEEQPAFNFSTFTGSILDGNTFEPLIGATVVLKINGTQAQMIDKTWSNPYITCKSTKGAYTFWVKPETAEKSGETKKFNFTLDITAPGYSPLIYNFELPVTSEASTKNEIDSTYSLKIKDLVIFKDDIINDME